MIRHQPLALIEIERDAFVAVIGKVRDHQQRVLRKRQQAILLRGNADARIGVQVDDAQRVFARGVDGRVDREARRIDVVRRRRDDVAVEIDLHQRRRRHLLEEHPVRVDQEVVVRARARASRCA